MADVHIEMTNTQAATLGRLLVEVALFASLDTLRPVLAAVRFENDNGRLKMLATDSYILGIVTAVQQPIDAAADWSTLVTATELVAIGKALAKLKSYGANEPATVALTFGARELVAECPAWTLRAHVFDGDYPKYESLLPVGDGTADNWPAVNVAYLGLLGKVLLGQPAPKRGKVTYQGVRIECFGDCKPLKLTGTSEYADFVGLLMPVRVKP